MDKVKQEMLKLYHPTSNLDWMNYKLVRKEITYHHIVKRCDSGKRTIDNGALLMPVAHQYLHLIEYKDIDTYNALNKIFSCVNYQGFEPSEGQRDVIEYLLREFERLHRWDKGRKGKLLIQRKYKDRSWNNEKR